MSAPGESACVCGRDCPRCDLDGGGPCRCIDECPRHNRPVKVPLWRQRRDRARKAAAASHKSVQAVRALIFAWIAKEGRAVRLPSGRTATVYGHRAVILGDLVGRQPSGRIKAYETGGGRVVLTREDRAVLARELAPFPTFGGAS